MANKSGYQLLLKNCGLRVTPQRIAVLEAVYDLKNHPSSDDIARYVKDHHPNIAVGTIYNILDSLVKADILKRVKTERGAMLYDAITEKHHHLYCSESDKIEDYYDQELDDILNDFFEKKKISGFEIEDIKLQLVGKFKNDK